MNREELRNLFCSYFNRKKEVVFEDGFTGLVFSHQDMPSDWKKFPLFYNNSYYIGKKEMEWDEPLPDGWDALTITIDNSVLEQEAGIVPCRNDKALLKEVNDKIQMGLDYKGFWYLVGNRLVQDAALEKGVQILVECRSVYEKLKSLADYEPRNIMLFIGKNVLEIDEGFRPEMAVETRYAKRFLSEDIPENNEKTALFKSVLQEALLNTPVKERLGMFFRMLDPVYQEYMAACGNFYEKFSLHKLKLELDESWINLNTKVRESNKDMKEEILLIVTASIALAQLDFTWMVASVAKNIMVCLCLLVCFGLYTWILRQDRLMLQHLDRMVLQEESRLKKITVDSNQQGEKERMIQADMDDIRNAVKRNRLVLWICEFVVWLPVLAIVVISCMMRNASSGMPVD